MAEAAVAITSITDILLPGQKIVSGSDYDSLYSKERRLQLIMQGDGNLVLKRNGEVCWASNTYGNHPTPCSLVMQESGELALFDNEGSKLLVVQPLRLDSDDRAHPLEPVPGCWFCLKEGYAALYHPRGSALWALLDGTAVEGDRRHNLVRVLDNPVWCRIWDIGPMERPVITSAPTAAMESMKLQPETLDSGTRTEAATDAPAGAPAPAADPAAPKPADLKGFVSKPKLSGPCTAVLLGPEDAVAVAGMTDTLLPGQKIESGSNHDSLYSEEGRLQLIMQEDGNLVLKRNDEVCWASGTYGIHPTPCSLVMQENGELAVFDKEFKKLWAVQLKEWDVDSKAWPIDPIPGSWFCLKDHYGPVYDPRGKPLWALYDGTEFRGDKHYYGVVELPHDESCRIYEIKPMDRPLRLDAYLDQPAGGAAVVAKALDAITWSADAVNNRLTKFLDAFREARTKLQTTAEDAGQLPQSEQTAATIALLTSLQNRFAEWQTKHDIEGGFKPIGDMVSVVKNDLPISGFKDKLEQLSDQLEVDIPQLPAAERGPAMDKVIKQVKHQLQQFDEKAQQLSAQIGAASRDCSGLWNDTNLLRADLRDVFRKIAVTIQQYRDVIIPGLREQLQTTEQEIAATQDRIRRFESEINDNRDKRDGPAGWLGIGGMVFESTGIPGFTDLGKEMQKPDRNLADANRQLEEQKHKANVTLKEEQDRQQEAIKVAQAAEKALLSATFLQPSIEQVANVSVALMSHVGRLQNDLEQAAAMQVALFAEALDEGQDGLLAMIKDVGQAIRDSKAAKDKV